MRGATLQPRRTKEHALLPESLRRRRCEVPGSRGNKYFDRAWEVPGVKELFDELKPSNGAAEGKDKESRARAEMRRNVDADYYGFNRDEDDGTKEVESFRNVERAGEEGALRVGHRLLVSG